MSETIYVDYHQCLSLLTITTVGLTLTLSELEGLATLQGEHSLALALSALDLKDDLLGSLSLLSKDGLSLTSETFLLGVVSSLTLGNQRGLTSLVLSDLVARVLLASLAVSISGLRNRDHEIILGAIMRGEIE